MNRATHTEKELSAIRMNLEEINGSLKQIPKAVTMIINNPLNENISETSHQIAQRLKMLRSASYGVTDPVVIKDDIPVKITWMTPELNGVATVIKNQDGRVLISILVEGEDADLVATLVNDQPVEALSLDSVTR
jgi:hypothetical protein